MGFDNSEDLNFVRSLIDKGRRRTLIDCIQVFVDAALSRGYTHKEIMEAVTDWAFQCQQEKTEFVKAIAYLEKAAQTLPD